MSYTDLTEKITPFLPSATFGKRLGIVAFLALGIAGYSHRESLKKYLSSLRSPITQTEEKKGEVVRLGTLVEKDTDGDGVPDWQETLFGLDPLKADTDGDGIGDKKEVEAIKGEIKENIDGSEDESIKLTDNKTSALGQDIFKSIAALSQSGNLNDATVEKIAASLGGQIDPSKTDLTSYTTTDLTIQKKEDLRTFLKNLDSILKKYDPTKLGLEDLNKAMETGDRKILMNLNERIIGLQNIEKSLLKNPIPDTLKDSYLPLLNALSHTRQHIEGSKDVFEDPITGMTHIIGIRKETDLFIQNIQSFQIQLVELSSKLKTTLN